MLFNKNHYQVVSMPRTNAKRATLAKAKAIKGACYSGKVWLVRQEYVSLLVAAPNEQEALDSAVDAGLWDCFLMCEAYYAEYSENGWDDSFIHAGNASEPFWCENLYIQQVL